MKKLLVLALISTMIVIACINNDKENSSKEPIKDADLLSLAQSLFQPISSLNIKQPDAHMVKLGKYLFFDTRLSGKGNISCNSCHNLETYGVDNKQFSMGDEGIMGGRNSPTVFHAALHSMQFWDGRAVDVEEQAGGPILNPIEHNIKVKQQMVDRLKKVDKYQEMFATAFKKDKNPITFDNLTRAIGAFERTLMPESRFDKYLEGDKSALNPQEKKGLDTFIVSGCITCHSGVALGGQMLQKFGLYEDYWKQTKSENIDQGLFDVSEKETEKYFFKVPGLRNITHTAPYFHDGSVSDLRETVRIMGKLQRNVNLTDEQIDDMVVFMGSLSSDIPDDVKKSPSQGNEK